MRTTFFLQKPRAANSLIFLQIFYKKQRVRISTGYNIPVKFWEPSTYRVSGTYLAKSEINAMLSDFENKALKVGVNSELNDYTIDEFKRDLFYALGLLEKNTGLDKANLFLPFFLDWATIGTPSKPHPRRGDLYSYRIVAGYTQENTTFDDIDYNYYNNITEYLRDVKKLKINSIYTHIRNIKAVMSEAYKRGLHSNTAFRRFPKITEEVDNVYLTTEELELILKAKLVGRLEKSRDLFIIGAYTALRYSDCSRIEPHWIKNGELHVIEKKTQGRIVIPLHKNVIQILAKYNYYSPASNQVYINKDIKEICRRCGIVELITTSSTRGKEIVLEVKEKWELVSSHTARRSGASNLIKLGMPPALVMQITGHRTENSFWKYVKITPEEYSELMQGWIDKL